MTPDWKRPLTCAIFLPGSSAKTKTVQTLTRVRRALEFSVCRNDPKEMEHHSPRSPDRLGEPAAPPRPWAGEIPRPALPAPLLRGRATPQLCARELLAAPAPPPGPPPRPPPAPLLESEGGALLGQPATPGTRLGSPAGRAQPSSCGSRRSEPPPAPAASSLARPRPPGPATLFRERSVPLGSRVGPAPASEATAGRVPRTWRLGSPDRAPGQSALALSAVPARSRWPGAERGAGIRNQSCVLRARSGNRHGAHAPSPLFKLSKKCVSRPPRHTGSLLVAFFVLFFFFQDKCGSACQLIPSQFTDVI